MVSFGMPSVEYFPAYPSSCLYQSVLSGQYQTVTFLLYYAHNISLFYIFYGRAKLYL